MTIDLAGSTAGDRSAPNVEAGSQDAAAEPTPLDVLSQFRTGYPDAQQAVDIFAGDWSSVLPESAGVNTGGFAGLFEDPRINWMVEELGGVTDMTILELGPLEGGHTHALEHRYGAAEITAIEANQRAYLKCLVAKEILGSVRSRFLLGDCNRYMAESGHRFDLVVACGVLYHMENPAEHIELLCRSADSIFVWTHYYNRELIEAIGPDLARKFSAHTPTSHDGYDHLLHRQDYLDALGWGGFCGAGREFANWIELPDIENLFQRFGFEITATAFHNTEHAHGPAIALIAKRSAA